MGACVQKSQKPKGAPSPVEIVMLLGKNLLLIDTGCTTPLTVAEPYAVPPAPVQAIVYVIFPAVFTGTVWLPLTGGVPVQPSLAAQNVALVDDHVRVAFDPTGKDVGLTEITAVGKRPDGEYPPPQLAQTTDSAARIQIEK